METTPDTANFMILGYIIFVIVMVAYLASLYSRWRKLEREQQTLDEIAKK